MMTSGFLNNHEKRPRQRVFVGKLTHSRPGTPSAAHDGTAVVQRPASEDASGNRVSILAEHGFSAVVGLTSEVRTRKTLFDFGFSEKGAL